MRVINFALKVHSSEVLSALRSSEGKKSERKTEETSRRRGKEVVSLGDSRKKEGRVCSKREGVRVEVQKV